MPEQWGDKLTPSLEETALLDLVQLYSTLRARVSRHSLKYLTRT